MKMDLHCHTRMSDGSDSVWEVVALARARGLDAIAVTDHDTFAGLPAAFAAAAELSGIAVIPGVEISCYDYERRRKVHILSYQSDESVLRPILRKTLESRNSAMRESLPVILRACPMPAEMVSARAAGSQAIYKQHVMHALIDAGYTDSLFGDLFRKLFDSKTGLAPTRTVYPDVRAVLEATRAAGGITVMAHPGEYHSLELLEELAAKNLLDGAELNHPKNTEADRKVIEGICLRYRKIMTGGTDFHGSYAGRQDPIGSFLAPESARILYEQKAGTQHETEL